MLDAPRRQVMLNREVWDLYADHRAWYLLELLTKRSYRWTIRRFLSKKSYKLQPLYLLLWAFSARYRAESRVAFPLTDEDRVLGSIFPSQFLDRLPNHIEAVANLKLVIYELLEEAGLITYTVTQDPPQDGAVPPGEAPNPTPAATP